MVRSPSPWRRERYSSSTASKAALRITRAPVRKPHRPDARAVPAGASADPWTNPTAGRSVEGRPSLAARPSRSACFSWPAGSRSSTETSVGSGTRPPGWRPFWSWWAWRWVPGTSSSAPSTPVEPTPSLPAQGPYPWRAVRRLMTRATLVHPVAVYPGTFRSGTTV